MLMPSDVGLKRIFKKYPGVKLAYLFGSRATGNGGPLSDFDFAIYLDKTAKNNFSKIKIKLLTDLGKLLKTNKIDIVILNQSKNSELKYNVIKEGKLIYEKVPYRILIEPKIMNEYFDFNYLLKKYSLTRT